MLEFRLRVNLKTKHLLLIVLATSLVLVGGALAATNTIVTIDGSAAGIDLGLYTSIALTSAGAPVMGYYDDTNDGLWVAICADVECTATTISFIASVGSGSFTSVAMTNTDFPIISYYDSVGADLEIAICTSTDCSTKSLVTLDPNLAGSYTSLDLTTAGNPVVSYYDHSASGDLKVAICADNACTTSTLVTIDGGVEDRGLFTSLQLAANVPVIAYHSLTGGDVYLARCTDAACTGASINLVDGANNVGYDQISLQLDGSGFPIMSYYDSTLTALKVAHCSDADCSGAINIAVVDNSGAVGQFSSIKWDGAAATISYYDATNGALKIAYCADADCSSASIETIDDTGDVGWDTSLALGSIYVSYYDVTNGALKYAYVPDPPEAGDLGAGGGPALLPETGFAQGRVTQLSEASVNYAATELQLVIPSLGVETDIVGVPVTDGGWDVSWLGNQAGLLEGGAFPTWPGNATLTGHVWNSYNQPGVFAGLSQLDYGDRIEIRAWGQTYVYEVRETSLVSARNLSVMDAKDDYSWITLVTCEGYDAASGDYWYRRAVSAVLVEVIP
jgi:LPXTG-site transpeptidase (sortase) family protein